eukprot:2978455-Pleurochrysis_carterae.AAC.1
MCACRRALVLAKRAKRACMRALVRARVCPCDRARPALAGPCACSQVHGRCVSARAGCAEPLTPLGSPAPAPCRLLSASLAGSSPGTGPQ